MRSKPASSSSSSSSTSNKLYINNNSLQITGEKINAATVHHQHHRLLAKKKQHRIADVESVATPTPTPHREEEEEEAEEGKVKGEEGVLELKLKKCAPLGDQVVTRQILPHDPKARRLFVTTGGLKRMQYIEAQPGTTLMEYVTIINSCFPEEIVRYYSPGYPETLLDKVEQYSPQLMSVLHEPDTKEDDVQAPIIQSSPSEELEHLLI